jgi:hypothetical protein
MRRVRVVEDLSGDGIELDAVFMPRMVPRSMGRKSKNRVRSASVARDNIFPLFLMGRLLVDPLQVRGLPAQAGAVVDDLGRQLLRGVVKRTIHRRRYSAGRERGPWKRAF